MIMLFLHMVAVVCLLAVCAANAQRIMDPIKSNDSEVQRVAAMYQKKDYKAAETLLAEILKKDGKNADAHYALALVVEKSGNVDGAIKEVNTAIKLNPKSAEYHYILSRLFFLQIGNANVFRKMSLSSSGKEALLEALRIDPNHKAAIISLANFCYQAPSIAGGDIGMAKELANSLVKMDELEGRILLCQVYNAEGDYPKAIEEAKKLMGTHEYAGRRMLTQIYRKHADNASAEREFKALEQKFGDNPDNFEFYNDYGYFLLEQGRIDEAVNKFKKQVALAPKNANAHDSLGEGYYKKGMLKESLDEYSKTLEIDPTLKSAKDKVAEIKRKLSR